MKSPGGSNGQYARTIDHAQGLSAPVAVCRPVLCARLYRSDQCELRRSYHARRPRHVGRHLRLCRRHVLLGLFYLRGPEQRDPGKGRSQNMDRADYDHLGNPCRPDRDGYGFDGLRDRALPAGRRRGRILSWHHSLLHLLVSEPSSRSHRVRLSGWSTGSGGGRRATEAIRKFTMWQALYNPKVLLLALNYLGIVTASLGMLIFIPQMIKSLGDYSNMTVGWLTMIPYTCGAIAMVVWGRISDRMNERRWNLFIGCVFSTVGLVIAGMTMGTWWALVGMSIAAMGFYGSKGPFFAMPPMFLSGAGLAAGIAWINSIGNLGGFFGPWYVGVMKDLTGSYAGGLYGLALLCLASAIVCALFLHIPKRVPSSAVAAPAE